MSKEDVYNHTKLPFNRKRRLSLMSYKNSTISKILEELDKNKEIIEVFFNYSLCTEDAKKLFDKLATMDSISKLVISKNCLRKEAGQYFLQYVKVSQNLKKLRLPKIYKDEKWESFCTNLKSNQSLVKLNIIEDKFISNKIIESIIMLFDSVKDNKHLKKLSFKKVPNEKSIFDSICNMLKINNTLEILGLHVDKPSERHFIDLCDAIKKNRTLKKINFNHSDLSDCANIISNLLSFNPTFKELELSYCEIKEDGFKSISEALSQNTNLEVIDLGYNNPGREGLKSFSSMLCTNKNLKEIRICYSQVGQSVIEILKEGLLFNDSLRVLKFNFCDIDKEGAKTISEFLLTKKWEQLYLDLNKCEDEGASHIFEALEKNKHMRIISMNSNIITNDGMKNIFHSLKFNNYLKTIFINVNVIEESGYLDLINLLKLNQTLIQISNCNINHYDKESRLESIFSLNQRICWTPCWSPDNHCSFEDDFQAKIMNFLLCHLIFSENKKMLKIPKYILNLIFNFCAIQYLIAKKHSILEQVISITTANSSSSDESSSKESSPKEKRSSKRNNGQNNNNNNNNANTRNTKKRKTSKSDK